MKINSKIIFSCGSIYPSMGGSDCKVKKCLTVKYFTSEEKIVNDKCKSFAERMQCFILAE